jgi:hypothetical protein
LIEEKASDDEEEVEYESAKKLGRTGSQGFGSQVLNLKDGE